MTALPTDWNALLALAFLLGLRHGVDADHIATIDGLTRLRSGRRGSSWCGAQFAFGHGAVVLLIIAGLAQASQGWQPPHWLAPLGAGLSIALLAALGLANLRVALLARPGEVVQLQGLRGRLLARLRGGAHPAAATAVGALFAASFDTVSLAALFALSGSAAGGATQALLLGAAFATGMLMVDGANGWWLARLLGAGGRRAARAARTTAGVVAVVSLTVASLGVARWVWPAADDWVEGLGPWLGVTLLLAVLVCTALLLWRSHPRAEAAVDRNAGVALSA